MTTARRRSTPTARTRGQSSAARSPFNARSAGTPTSVVGCTRCSWQAGLVDIEVSPRQVYVDGGRPALADGFVRRTFTAMVQGVRTPALPADLIDEQRFDRGIADLLRTAQPDGTFSHTFHKDAAHTP